MPSTFVQRTNVVFLLLLAWAPAALHAQGKKPLRWGADQDGGAPYVLADPDHPEKIIGFEADLAKALEKELGRAICFEQRAFQNLVPDLERQDIDLAMNGLEILPEHLERVAFTKPYYLYQQQLVIRQDDQRFAAWDPDQHPPWEKYLVDLAKEKGMVVGTLEGAAAERWLKKRGVDFKPYENQQGPYKDLDQKVVDAVLMDLPIAVYYAAPDKFFLDSEKKRNLSQYQPGVKFVGPPFAEGYYGIAVRKGDTQLLQDLNAALERLRDNGVLKEILQRWQLWSPDQYRLYEGVHIQGQAQDMSFSKYFPLLLQGALTTIYITFASFLLAMLLGLGLAVARMYGPAPLRWCAIGYIEFFRGIPVLLLLYFLYYGLPDLMGLKLGALTAAILGFGLNYAAYEAEIYRGGISSISLGQWEAAASLGMAPALTFRRIILPQAIRVILPPSTNDLVALFKDTSVVSIIAVTELSKQYQILTKSGGGYLQIGLVTAALYLIMSVPLSYLSRRLEQRWGPLAG